MTKKTLIFIGLFHAILLFGTVKPALACGEIFGSSCKRLSVDLRTDYRPGVDFIMARAILTPPGITQDLTVFSTSPLADGMRIAEFGGLNDGDHFLDVQLIRSDGSILDTNRTTIYLNDDLAVTKVMTRPSDPEPTCEQRLADMQVQLDALTKSQNNTMQMQPPSPSLWLRGKPFPGKPPILAPQVH